MLGSDHRFPILAEARASRGGQRLWTYDNVAVKKSLSHPVHIRAACRIAGSSVFERVRRHPQLGNPIIRCFERSRETYHVASNIALLDRPNHRASATSGRVGIIYVHVQTRHRPTPDSRTRLLHNIPVRRPRRSVLKRFRCEGDVGNSIHIRIRRSKSPDRKEVAGISCRRRLRHCLRSGKGADDECESRRH